MANGNGKKKTDVECSMEIAKLILFIFNLVFMICGGTVLSFGIIALVDPELFVSIMESSNPDFVNIQYVIDIAGFLLSKAVVMVIGGSIIFVVSFLGWCMSSNKCLIFTYWFTILLLLFFELAVIMWAAIENEKIQDKVADLMFTALKTNFHEIEWSGDGTVIMSNNSAQLAWEKMQYEHACCGARNYTDYTLFQWNNTISSSANATVPLSCCMQNDQYKIPDKINQFVKFSDCLTSLSNSTKYRNIQGCNIPLISEVTTKNFIPTVVIAGLIALEVVMIMLALAMQMKMNKISPKSPSSDPAPDYD